MSKSLRILSVLLMVSACAFSQKRDSPLHYGETLEENYIIADSPFLIRPISKELYYFIMKGDSCKRVYFVKTKGDTADMVIGRLPELLKDIKVLKVGGIYFKRQEKEILLWNW